MKSSSIKALVQEYPAIKAREYRDILIHEWHIPDSYKNIPAILESVKITTWNLHTNLNDGQLFYKSKQFNITWLSGPKAVKKARFAIISFRWCVYLNSGYALIKIYEEDGINNNIQFINDKYLGR